MQDKKTQEDAANGFVMINRGLDQYTQQCIQHAMEKGVGPFTALSFANTLIDILNDTLKNEASNICSNILQRRTEIRNYAKLVYTYFCNCSGKGQDFFNDNYFNALNASKSDMTGAADRVQITPLRAIWPPLFKLPESDDGRELPYIAKNLFTMLEPLIRSLLLSTAKSVKGFFSYSRQSTVAAEIEDLCAQYRTLIKETGYDEIAGTEPQILMHLADEKLKECLGEENPLLTSVEKDANRDDKALQYLGLQYNGDKKAAVVKPQKRSAKQKLLDRLINPETKSDQTESIEMSSVSKVPN